MLRVLLCLIVGALSGGLGAHTVPGIVVEAEFSAGREALVKVNLDPRLFLSAQPTSLPPVPATWWFEQDDTAKEDSLRKAVEHVQQVMEFRAGGEVLEGDWKVQAIDSASAFPLGQGSAEVHLLLERRSLLSAAGGDFQLAVSKSCAVAVILLCSRTGDAERRPEALFPGETSRAFPLPVPVHQPVGAVESSSSRVAGGRGAAWMIRQCAASVDHLLLAALLGIVLHRRFWLILGVWMGFHAMDLVAAALVMAGWLPAAPGWMVGACWMLLALAAVQVLVHKSGAGPLLTTFAVAGLCHGLSMAHVLVQGVFEASVGLLLSQTGTLLVLELCVAVVALVLRRTVQRGASGKACAAVA